MKHWIIKSVGCALILATMFIPFICVVTPYGSQISVGYHFPYEYFTQPYVNVVAITYLFALVAYVLCLMCITNRWGMLASTLPLLSVNLLLVSACCGLFSYNELQCVLQYIAVFAIYIFNYAVVGHCHVEMSRRHPEQ